MNFHLVKQIFYYKHINKKAEKGRTALTIYKFMHLQPQKYFCLQNWEMNSRLVSMCTCKKSSKPFLPSLGSVGLFNMSGKKGDSIMGGT